MESLLPDVVLVDIDTPGDVSLKLVRKVNQRLPNIGVMVLTSNPDDDQLFRAIKAQAAAYLSKEVTAEKLFDILKRTAAGEHPINESLTTPQGSGAGITRLSGARPGEGGGGVYCPGYP